MATGLGSWVIGTLINANLGLSVLAVNSALPPVNSKPSGKLRVKLKVFPGTVSIACTPTSLMSTTGSVIFNGLELLF